jgi:phosphatidylglycerol phospholipase C
MQPGSKHVVLNIDVKLDNDPELLYPLMRREIESFPGWETELAPRLILGAPLSLFDS